MDSRKNADMEFSPGNSTRLHLAVVSFSLYVVGPTIIFLLFAAALEIFVSLLNAKPIPSERLVETVFLLLGLYAIYWSPVFVNQHNVIRVNDGGLSVRIFTWRYNWRLIPWDDVIDVELLPRLDPWNQPMWGILVKSLTPWHKYLGKFYGAGKYPVILLSSQLENRDLLIDMIIEKIK
jgi:hypothetical protein